MMIMASIRTISILGILILGSLMIQPSAAADHLPIPLKANCSSDRFQCANGGCIPLDDVCNCYNNCGDLSDEADCNDLWNAGRTDRALYSYYCPDGGCVSYLYICLPGYGGKFKKEHGSGCDEKHFYTNCSMEAPCHRLQYECSNGKCIQLQDVCNGFNDCGDRSDELNCTGKCSSFECNNGKCLYDSMKCDCKDDCGDGSDEIDCEDEISQCSNGKCLLNSNVCNCKDDCGDGSDEENCDDRTFQCPEGTCLLSSKVCNCEDDCIDGADEANCEKDCEIDYRFRCPFNGTLIDAKYLNDGFDDCGDGTDENYCSAEPFNCGHKGCLQDTSICENQHGCTNRSDGENCVGKCTEFQCPGGGPCIHNNKVCDCIDDCGDGADEKNCTGLYTKLKKFRSLDSFETHKYHCRDGTCFGDLSSAPELLPCDGGNHCKDWSDEMECAGKCREFECPSGRCIDSRYLCDGINDCGDWTDEKLCPDDGCKDFQYQCSSGQCIHKNYYRAKCDSSWCRDGSDQENCDAEKRFDGPFSNTFSNSQCNVIDAKEGMSLRQCLAWCETDPACTAVNYNEEYRDGGCVRRACSFPVPRPQGTEHDKSWKGYSQKSECTNGTKYQTKINNGTFMLTCVNGKYESKEILCINGSAKILEDGCNYCICVNGEYKFCTERTCKINENINNEELSAENSPQQIDRDSTHIDNRDSSHPANEISTKTGDDH